MIHERSCRLVNEFYKRENTHSAAAEDGRIVKITYNFATRLNLPLLFQLYSQCFGAPIIPKIMLAYNLSMPSYHLNKVVKNDEKRLIQ